MGSSTSYFASTAVESLWLCSWVVEVAILGWMLAFVGLDSKFGSKWFYLLKVVILLILVSNHRFASVEPAR